MNEAPLKYARLGPRTRNTQGLIAVARIQNSLWLGPDHVLSVERTMMHEDYKRFYFRDIQSITVQETDGAMHRNWAYGSLIVLTVGLFGLFASLSDSNTAQYAWMITGGILSAVWLLRLLLNLLRGPTCLCRLRTEVQTADLPSLGRLKAAQKVLRRLEPIIEQTQGALPIEALGRRQAETTPPTPPGPPGPPGAKAPPPLRPPASGAIHLALFAALILDAAAGLYKHVHPVWHLHLAVSAFLLLLATGLSLAALVKQQDTTLPDGLRRFTVVTFGGMLAILFGIVLCGTIYRMLYAMRHLGQMATQMDFYSLPGFWPISLGTDCLELGFGVAGLALTLGYRRRLATAATSAPHADVPARPSAVAP